MPLTNGSSRSMPQCIGRQLELPKSSAPCYSSGPLTQSEGSSMSKGEAKLTELQSRSQLKFRRRRNRHSRERGLGRRPGLPRPRPRHTTQAQLVVHPTSLIPARGRLSSPCQQSQTCSGTNGSTMKVTQSYARIASKSSRGTVLRTVKCALGIPPSYRPS